VSQADGKSQEANDANPDKTAKSRSKRAGKKEIISIFTVNNFTH